jgi:hypothetical protein
MNTKIMLKAYDWERIKDKKLGEYEIDMFASLFDSLLAF